MRKIYIPYIVFCILLITLFVIMMFNEQDQSPYYSENTITENKVIKKTQENKIDEKEREYYIVKANDESIYLYDNRNNILDKLNINYDNLREYDKKQFNVGIKLTDMLGVYQLIEDFSN